ncbi:SDR family oxidoreductase [Oceanicoccus sagamiensis]|uniref:Short-chain dehydrogenase n=1 Tax=Oceanicoccus sagamiensis TaxID=716816 RepID=A0A1X9NAF3_9GAMM|nr:SDR family oxidoreductase [Oceanicoccus sagamiensis]ARN74606.1 hypothetical protein BST96_11015 [Oceanicoccus sagamiensis]
MSHTETPTQRVALVTGANRGIGLEVTRQLARQGIHVVATTRSESMGQALVNEMTAAGLSVSSFVLEVTDTEQCQALFGHISKAYGRLDILVNNAGIAPDQWQSGFQLDIDLFREVMDVNVYSALRLIQLFTPMMQSQGYGRIVNLSSELASLATSEMGSTLAYRTSKGALNTVTKLLSLELKDAPNIKMNAAAPGWCQTELGGEGAPRTAAEGADTVVWLATLPEDGPTGGFYRDREPYPW